MSLQLSIREELWNLDPSDRILVNLYADETDQEHTLKIYYALAKDIFLVRLKQLLWKQASTVESRHGLDININRVITSAMEEHGYKDILKNFVQKIYDHSLLHMKLSSSLPIAAYARKSIDEPLDHIRSVRMHWEQGILEELKAIIQESKRPFMLLRDSDAVNPFLQQTSMISSEKEGGVKFLFDSEDLMETILAIKNSNMKAIQAERSLGLIKLNVATPDFDKLSRRYAEFHNSHSQLGLDDAHANAQGFKVLAQRHEEAEAIIASGSILDARKLMRRGVPPSLRCKIWRIACGLHESVTAVEEQHFLRLRKQCDTMDLITDELFMHDIQTVLDDPRFFVFEEELKEVVLSFSRDEWVREHTSYDIHAPLLNQMGLDFEKSAAPPCGLQPYLGFATYFAPLCYIFRDKTSLYHVSKFLFCTLWCRMNVISASVEYDNTLIYVCKTFENLLIQFHPQLVIHMINIGLPPLKVAFPWMQLGFVGLLEMEQLLHLWERIIGYMDTTMLAVAAVAIFIHRSEMLLRCQTDQEAMMVLMEGSRLHIITLIQTLLLKDTRSSAASL